MGKERRAFSEEFKKDAVRRLSSGKDRLSVVAAELGLSPSLLQTWRRKYESTPGEGSREGAVVVPLEEEIAAFAARSRACGKIERSGAQT